MKIVLTLVLLVFSLQAKVIDKIAIVVNNIPITTYDIEKATQKTKNQNIAVQTLINDALIKSAIKEKGIYVDDFDIENRLEEIAKHNGMSLFDFKTMLIQKGELESLKESIKKELEISKLLSYYNKHITKDDVQNYYNTHKDEFKLPKTIETTIYSSNNPNTLKKVIENPLMNSSNVKIEEMSFEYNKTNPKLMSFLSKVKENSFSQIVPMSKNSFSLFYVTKKEGEVTLPFNMVANIIFEKLSQANQQKAMQHLLAKLKAKADIQFLH
jgi:peptidyl-prolyl cis-trans isomerase SurA